MEKIVSNLRTTSAEFAENRRKQTKRLPKPRGGGCPQARRRHTERRKLLVRDRIEKLLDPGTPFLELSPLAAYDMYDNDAPSSGLVTGVGVIHGREAVIIAND